MRLIDADAMMDVINNIPSSMSVCLSMDECKGMKHMKQKAYMAIFEAPTVDAVPVVRAKWEWNDHNGYYYCEKCGGISPRENQDGEYCDCPPFCPYCGAKMEAGE